MKIKKIEHAEKIEETLADLSLREISGRFSF